MNTCVCAVSFCNAETPLALIKQQLITIIFPHCRVRSYAFVYLFRGFAVLDMIEYESEGQAPTTDIATHVLDWISPRKCFVQYNTQTVKFGYPYQNLSV